MWNWCAIRTSACAGNEILQIGTRPPASLRPQRTISARHVVAVPGFINIRHHLFQTLTRACTTGVDAELFDRLRVHYPLWAHHQFGHSGEGCGFQSLFVDSDLPITDRGILNRHLSRGLTGSSRRSPEESGTTENQANQDE